MKRILIFFFCLLSLSASAKKLYVNENYNKTSWDIVVDEAKKGNVSAMNILGRGYGDHFWAFDKKLADKKRLKYLLTAAEYGYPYSMAELELVYSQGLLGVKSDQDLSYSYKQKALLGFKRYANMGDSEAMVAYSDRLPSSQLSEKTYWLLFAAQQGNVDAVIEMVNLYDWGIYTPKNPLISNAWRARLNLTKDAKWNISLDVKKYKEDLQKNGYSDLDYEKLAYPTYLQVAKYSVDDVDLIGNETKRLLSLYRMISPQKSASNKVVASKGKQRSGSRSGSRGRSNGKRSSKSSAKSTAQLSSAQKNSSSTNQQISNVRQSQTSSHSTQNVSRQSAAKSNSRPTSAVVNVQGFPAGQTWYFSLKGKGMNVWKVEFYIDKLGNECCKMYNHKWTGGMTYVHDGTHQDGSYKFTFFNGYTVDINAAMRGQRVEKISYFVTNWNNFASSLSFTRDYRTMHIYPYPESNVYGKCTKQQFDVKYKKLKQNYLQMNSSPSAPAPGGVTTPSRPKVEWQKSEHKSLARCRACGGSGRCPVCNGTGDRADTHNWDESTMYWRCTRCGGSGRCDVCRGTGFIRY